MKRNLLNVSEIGSNKETAIRVLLLEEDSQYFVTVDHNPDDKYWTEKEFSSKKIADRYFDYAVNAIAYGMD